MRRIAPILAVATALAAATPALAAPSGSIIVANQSGATMQVSIPGVREATSVRNGETILMSAPLGTQTVKAYYTQFGTARTLEVNTVSVRPNRAAMVTLDREDEARVLVSNQTTREAQVFAGSQLVLSDLDPGESQVVTLPIGCQKLQMIGENGRILGETTLELRAYAEPAWTVEMPRDADLMVNNPLPISVRIELSTGQTRVIESGERAVFAHVELGTVHVRAERLDGRLVDEQDLRIRCEDANSWRVAMPKVGDVFVDNDLAIPVTVFADGYKVASLAEYADRKIELSTGSHELRFVDARGREVGRRYVTVDAFDMARVDIDNPAPNPQRPPSVASNGWDDHGDDHHQGPSHYHQRP